MQLGSGKIFMIVVNLPRSGSQVPRNLPKSQAKQVVKKKKRKKQKQTNHELCTSQSLWASLNMLHVKIHDSTIEENLT